MNEKQQLLADMSAAESLSDLYEIHDVIKNLALGDKDYELLTESSKILEKRGKEIIDKL